LFESCQRDVPKSRQLTAALVPAAGTIRVLKKTTAASLRAGFPVRGAMSIHLSGETTMRTLYAVGFAMFAGFALGAVAVQGLHAQTKPPIYLITEIDTPNMDTYMKDYAPLAQKSIRDAGGRIVAGGPGKSIEGDPPKARVTVQVWESPEKMLAWRSSAEYKKAREVGDKLAKFRSFTVEGAN
jgi:uncharacterized protein (DUF1330 family)